VIKSLKRALKLVGSTTGVAFLVAVLVASTAIAVAAEPTRESYKEQVEPICKKNTESIERILKGVKAQIRNGQLKAAAGKFTRAANAFEQATKQLKAVPQPSADSAKLGKWIAQLETGTGLLRKISAALKAEKKGKVASYSSKLTTNSTIANSLVLGFDFDYCLVESSKFT
jgi:hypothetical protein